MRRVNARTVEQLRSLTYTYTQRCRVLRWREEIAYRFPRLPRTPRSHTKADSPSFFLGGRGDRHPLYRSPADHDRSLLHDCAANPIQKYGYVNVTAVDRRRRRHRRCVEFLGGNKKGYQHQGLDCFFFLRPIFLPNYRRLVAIGSDPPPLLRRSSTCKYTQHKTSTIVILHMHTRTHAKTDNVKWPPYLFRGRHRKSPTWRASKF